MSLTDEILKLVTQKEYADTDLRQMAEVMSYAKPEENFHRLKVLLVGRP